MKGSIALDALGRDALTDYVGILRPPAPKSVFAPQVRR